jgi:tetratricopeptide (TPR) repeat protein
MTRTNLISKRVLLLSGTIALAVACIYLPALQNEFVFWDDYEYIVNNEQIRSLDWPMVTSVLFGFDAVRYWLPLVWISYAVEYHFVQSSPILYHLDNILLHALNTFFVCMLTVKLIATDRLIRRLPGLPQAPLMVACLAVGIGYGLHPLRVESVAWVAERKDVLSSCFSLGTLLCYLSYGTARIAPSAAAARSGKREYLLSLLCFILALMSKPMVVTLPAVLFIIDWLPLRRFDGKEQISRLLLEKAPFLAGSLLVSFITHAALKSTLMMPFPLPERLVYSGQWICGYLRNMLWPFYLSTYYEYPARNVELMTPQFLAPLIGILAVTALACAVARKSIVVRYALAAWGSFLITLLPVLGIFQMTGSQAMADRFTYLPAIGPTVLAAAGLCWLCANLAERSGSARRPFAIIAGGLTIVAMLYATLTLRMIAVWHDTESLWSRAIMMDPHGASRAYFHRGDYFATIGQYDEAAMDLTRSLEAADLKGYSIVHRILSARGDVWEKMGRYDDSLRDYTEAISRSPVPEVHYYLQRASLLEKLGRSAEAEKDRGVVRSMVSRNGVGG